MRTLILLSLILILSLPAATQSQTAHVRAYFDEGLTQAYMQCPDDPKGTVLGTLHIAVDNINEWFTAVEFRVYYPPSMLWIADIPSTPLMLGSSPDGIALSWTIPQSGFGRVRVLQAMFLYMCTGCSDINDPGDPDLKHWIRLDPHLQTGHIRYVRASDSSLVELAGYHSVIGCLQLPVETSTWGRLKSLYE